MWNRLVEKWQAVRSGNVVEFDPKKIGDSVLAKMVDLLTASISCCPSQQTAQSLLRTKLVGNL